MKFTYSNTKEDFFIFYFSQVFLKKTNPVSLNPKSKYYIYNFTKVFNTSESKIRSLILDPKTKIQLFKKENFNKFKDYHFIFDFYKEINNNKLEYITNLANSKIENFIKYLELIFGKSNLGETLEMAFVQLPLKEAYVAPDAFTTKAIDNKIFFGFDNNISLEDKEKINYYVLVIFHELTHLFINKNTQFQMIFKQIWKDKYNYIEVTRFRMGIEEILTCSLVYPFYATGYTLQALNFKENLKGKQDLFNKRTYFKVFYSFLENLKNDKEKDSLEKYFSELIKELVKGGLFKD